MTCHLCDQPESDHKTVTDDGRVKRYCPETVPPTEPDTALERIRAIRAQLKETT